MAYSTPKTDWVGGDIPDEDDLNRIESNTKHNHDIGHTGWIPVTDSWTYASATTITVPSGAASIYRKGYPIRLKQGGGYKYFNIITVADTLLTVTGGDDYSVANSAITDKYYSVAPDPIGFPDSFSFAPYLAGSTTAGSFTYTTQAGKVSIVGSVATYSIIIDVASVVSAAVGYTRIYGLPVASATIELLTIGTRGLLLGGYPIAYMPAASASIQLYGGVDNAAFGTTTSSAGSISASTDVWVTGSIIY